MKRKIIEINEEKCNGCGKCINICAEAALELVDGKAKLTKDFFCDGLGACLDVCPVDALKIVEKDSDEYSPTKAYEHVKNKMGETEAKKIHDYDKIKSTVEKETQSNDEPMKCGCPSSMMRDFRDKDNQNTDETISIKAESELRQWPIQLHLQSPAAPYFKDADLVIAADCVPFTYANFHARFLKDKILIMFCPKLDLDMDQYVEKLTDIFKHQNIKSLTIVHMEVPCCGGVEHMIKQALAAADKNITIKDYTISVQGALV